MSDHNKRYGRLATWYFLGALVALAIGWFAAAIHQSGHAPLILLPLAVGAALGATVSQIAATLQVAGRKSLIVGILLLALLSVLAEHAWLYQGFRRQWHEARAGSAQVALFRPETPWSPTEYFQREITTRRAALWVVDASLIAAAAVGVALMMHRRRQEIRPCGRRQPP